MPECRGIYTEPCASTVNMDCTAGLFNAPLLRGCVWFMRLRKEFLIYTPTFSNFSSFTACKRKDADELANLRIASVPGSRSTNTICESPTLPETSSPRVRSARQSATVVPEITGSGSSSFMTMCSRSLSSSSKARLMAVSKSPSSNSGRLARSLGRWVRTCSATISDPLRHVS